jgi:ketosteroid isomerase-like protein
MANETLPAAAPLTREAAEAFAREWVEAWNSHDLARILAHYAEDVEFASPFVIAITGEASGTLRGKAALADYFAKGLPRYPSLHFRLQRVLAGVRSVTIAYESVNELDAAEVMELDRAGRVVRVQCHYAPRG